jgi:cytochrome c-type biogenesis protein CcmE
LENCKKNSTFALDFDTYFKSVLNMKKSYLVVLVLIGVLLGYIISTSSSYSTYESFATAHSNSGKQFQVVGKLVKDKPMEYKPEVDANRFSFYMIDEQGNERKVNYLGSRPQDFEKSEQIVLTGKMEGEEFTASKILLKCPSKYIANEVDANGFYDAAKSKPTAAPASTTAP